MDRSREHRSLEAASVRWLNRNSKIGSTVRFSWYKCFVQNRVSNNDGSVTFYLSRPGPGKTTIFLVPVIVK